MNNCYFSTIDERRYFFRMIEKIERRGYRAGDLFTLKIKDLKQMPELTANNLLIILQLQEMYKEAQNNAQRKCRIHNN